MPLTLAGKGVRMGYAGHVLSSAIAELCLARSRSAEITLSLRQTETGHAGGISERNACARTTMHKSQPQAEPKRPKIPE
eukprot:3857906-Prymnesium_polylepis.1